MIHEKYITLDTGRTIKLTLKGTFAPEQQGIDIDLNVLIKDPKDESFHPPIGSSHPKYWKLKSMDDQKSRLMQLKYSGIRDKQLRKALKELKQMMDLSAN